MYVKCWGARGSIPVSGPQYNRYGGDTACMEIRNAQDDILIIDAGTGIRRLGNQLLEERRFHYHLLFTHAHWDHLMGFPFFKPIFREGTTIHVFRCPSSNGYAESMITRVMTPPNFPIKYSDLKAKILFEDGCPQPFFLGDLKITPIALSHPNGGCGYRFTERGKNFVFLTDNELGYCHPGGLRFSDYLDFCKDADFLVHDAEYTPEEYAKKICWGHSSYTDVVELGIAAGVRRLGLFHHNQERSDTAIDAIVEDARQRIRNAGSSMECFALAADMHFNL
ncbi:phosphoribosyl 1,2-cyclic phosphodiesterase [Desulfobotulus alkaliphilus]|uniref:Phosphoribosyl 1,2-cyclic phosphodiesterase n=1 Tax=Desulfobotulus alkaliphilus TaxID=622671 RepID=A0A562RW26_9BACT|nr:MBL fold metallo-hydrolase [Desulfobotulus alkaliphilus]TWI73282.1 phosphoribosyl 1,2-cyclic phosphodiesterase [Desulfobotulus alkaliphilus]